MPGCIVQMLEAYPEKRSITEWAFRWLYDQREASVILSGTSNVDQLKENLQIFESAEYDCLSEGDQELIARIRAGFEAQNTIDCTACCYCMPCPQNVAIPEVFRMYNTFKLLDGSPIEKIVYTDSLVGNGKGADQCTECGACLEKCPQKLAIPDILKTAHEELLMPGDTLATFARDRD